MLFKTSNHSSRKDQIEEEKQKLREEFEEKIRELKEQYEEEKMSKEALMKQMDAIKLTYDSQINSLDDSNIISEQMNGNEATSITTNSNSPVKPKSGKTNRKVSGLKKNNSSNQLNGDDGVVNSDLNNESTSNIADINDPEQRLLKLQGN